MKILAFAWVIAVTQNKRTQAGSLKAPESFVPQQQREALEEENSNQRYFPQEYLPNFQSKEYKAPSPLIAPDAQSVWERSPVAKFLLLKGEIKDTNDDVSLLDSLMPSKERVVISHPVFPPPPMMSSLLPPPMPHQMFPFPQMMMPIMDPMARFPLGPPPDMGPMFPDFPPDMGPEGPGIGPMGGPSGEMPETIIIPPARPEFQHYFVDDTGSESKFGHDFGRFKGVSHGNLIDDTRLNKPKAKDYHPSTLEAAGRKGKDKGKFHNLQKFIDFDPEPEPAGCSCGPHYMKYHWPREKRCVKRCAYHQMLKERQNGGDS